MLHRTWSVRLGALSGYVFCGLADAYPSEDWNRAFISAREAVPKSSEWCREDRLMLTRRFDRATHEI